MRSRLNVLFAVTLFLGSASASYAQSAVDLREAVSQTSLNGCAAIFVRGQSLDEFRRTFVPKWNPESIPLLSRIQMKIDRGSRIFTVTSRLPDGSIAVDSRHHVPGYGCMPLVAGRPIDFLLPADDTPRSPELEPVPPDPSQSVRANLISPILAKAVESGNTIGIVVLEHGRLLGEAYARGYDRRSMWNTASTSKSITATLAGRMIQKGLMSVDGLVPLRALREAQGFPSAVRIADLLRQSSGLKCPGDDAEAELSPDGLVKYYVNGGSYAYPGSKHAYRDSCNHSLLNAAIGEVAESSGLDMRTLVRRELFDKLGMNRTAKAYADPLGNLLGGAGYNASPRDMARLGQLYLQRGKWNGEQLLPVWWVDYVTLPDSALEDGGGDWKYHNGPSCLDYGASFWLQPGSLSPDCLKEAAFPILPADAYHMTGWKGQYVIIIPSRDMVIVRMGFEAAGDEDGALFGRILAATQR